MAREVCLGREGIRGEAEAPCPHILEFVAHTVKLHHQYERESTERSCPLPCLGNVKPFQVHSSGPSVIGIWNEVRA